MNIDPSLLGTIGNVIQALGAIFGLAAAIWARSGKRNSERADQSAQQAADESMRSASALENANVTIQQLTDGLAKLKVRHDDLMAAYLRQDTLESRIRLVESYLAAQERAAAEQRRTAAIPSTTEPAPAPAGDPPPKETTP